MDKTFKIPPHLLDDLCSRFILNIPDSYRMDSIRTFFQIELAHWYYIDFFMSEEPEILKPIGIKDFAIQVFEHCPFLVPESMNVQTLHRDWKRYKLAVPTAGVILLDTERKYVLLVQGFSKSWGFPKGKINEAEIFIKAAVRELIEETGYDATGQLSDSDYVEHTVGDQQCRLYILPDVSFDTKFMPQTRNEIKNLRWFPIDCLPTHRKDTSKTEILEAGPNSFFMVLPFLKPLKRWISQNPPRTAQQKEAQLQFAQKNLSNFEEVFSLSPTVSPSRYKSPDVGGRKRNRKPASRSTPVAAVQREENMKKIQNLKSQLRMEGGANQGRSPTPADEKPIKPCDEWKNFRLNIKAIVDEVFAN